MTKSLLPGWLRIQLGFGFAVALLLSGLLASGCKSAGNSGKESKAEKGNLLITNASPGVVKGAAIDVFEAQGYKLSRNETDLLVFEKLASKWNNIAYGNWMESKLWERYKLKVDRMNETTVHLHGAGYVVRDKGGSTEEEIKNYRQGNYDKLLDEIGARFKPKE